jgi:hypothetical protein
MKELRLNDKIWFGKYKDKRVVDVLDLDKNFLDKMVESGKYFYSDNVKNYIYGDNKKKKLSYSSYHLSSRYRPVILGG